MKKTFIKMHGLGNDFAVFDGREDGFGLTEGQIRTFSHRRTGIGFDQCVIICAGNIMKIYNADGSEVGACGNATRCVGALLMDESGADEIVLKTKAGELKCWRADKDFRQEAAHPGESRDPHAAKAACCREATRDAHDLPLRGNVHAPHGRGPRLTPGWTDLKISVDMGPARLGWAEIPLRHELDTLSLPVTEGMLQNPVGVNMGNPHAVFFVEDAAAVPLDVIGTKVEHHPLFPERTNVEAAQVLSRDKIRMRVWERGTGITMACGTGACATAVAGVRRGLTDRNVEIILDGGSLFIEWRAEDGHVLMTGAAAEAFRGEIFL